jgi:hypothetical protein
MFQFPAFASDPLWIQEPDTLILQRKTKDPGGSLPQGLETPVAEGGFPHSEIPGSKPVRGSPGLIAAYHVLHRLSAPRHPPDALLSLDRSHCRCPRKPKVCRAPQTKGLSRGAPSPGLLLPGPAIDHDPISPPGPKLGRGRWSLDQSNHTRHVRRTMVRSNAMGAHPESPLPPVAREEANASKPPRPPPSRGQPFGHAFSSR